MAGLISLLFALNFSLALPPEAIMFSGQPSWPEVHPSTHVGRQVGRSRDSPGAADHRDRPWTGHARGRRRAALRPGGLARSFPGSSRGAAPSSPSAWARPDHTRVGGATTADLWRLARVEIVRHGTAYSDLTGLGDDALLDVSVRPLSLPGSPAIAWRRSASAPWTVGEQDHWIHQATHSLAAVVDNHLQRG